MGRNLLKAEMMINDADQKIITSALAANLFVKDSKTLISALASQSQAVTIAQSFGSSKLIRELRLARYDQIDDKLLKLEQQEKSYFTSIMTKNR